MSCFVWVAQPRSELARAWSIQIPTLLHRHDWRRIATTLIFD